MAAGRKVSAEGVIRESGEVIDLDITMRGEARRAGSKERPPHYVMVWPRTLNDLRLNDRAWRLLLHFALVANPKTNRVAYNREEIVKRGIIGDTHSVSVVVKRLVDDGVVRRYAGDLILNPHLVFSGAVEAQYEAILWWDHAIAPVVSVVR